MIVLERNASAIVSRNRTVVTKTWNDLKPPTTTYNHLKKFNNHLQKPQKHQQPLATDDLKQDKA